MIKFVEKTAKTVDEAVKLALEELNVTQDKAKIEVLEQPSKGIFGLIGSRLAKVRVEFEEEEIKDDKEIAQKFLRDVLENMNIKAEIRIRKHNDTLHINLAGPKMGIIIGRRGQTLDSLQYLISLVVNKQKERNSYVKVILDTEDYRRKREETLYRLASRLAERVIKTGKRVELEPMNPYERRIIHSALQSYNQITTYSEGEEPYRKVVIAHK